MCHLTKVTWAQCGHSHEFLGPSEVRCAALPAGEAPQRCPERSTRWQETSSLHCPGCPDAPPPRPGGFLRPPPLGPRAWVQGLNTLPGYQHDFVMHDVLRVPPPPLWTPPVRGPHPGGRGRQTDEFGVPNEGQRHDGDEWSTAARERRWQKRREDEEKKRREGGQ